VFLVYDVLICKKKYSYAVFYLSSLQEYKKHFFFKCILLIIIITASRSMTENNHFVVILQPYSVMSAYFFILQFIGQALGVRACFLCLKPQGLCL